MRKGKTELQKKGCYIHDRAHPSASPETSSENGPTRRVGPWVPSSAPCDFPVTSMKLYKHTELDLPSHLEHRRHNKTNNTREQRPD